MHHLDGFFPQRRQSFAYLYSLLLLLKIHAAQRAYSLFSQLNGAEPLTLRGIQPCVYFKEARASATKKRKQTFFISYLEHTKCVLLRVPSSALHRGTR